MSFRITGLPADLFTGLFDLTDDELAARHAVRRTADAPDAFPCRVSLTDAALGDQLVLVNFEHLPVASPYRARHAIYVRPGEQTFDAIDTVPEQLRRRTLAARAFDDGGMMVGCELVEGRDIEPALERLLDVPGAEYLHLHYARPGCYAARVVRA
jgi:hypothetical protein